MRLRSVVFDTIWPARHEFVAGCNHVWVRVPLPRRWRRAIIHEAPFRPCSCGIHATNDVEAAADYLYLYDDLQQPHLRYRAIGRVCLWGSVVEGENGWRASHAYPERIFLPRTDRYGRPTDVEAIREGLSHYGVPIQILDDDADTSVARAIEGVKPKRRRRRAQTNF